MVFDLDGTLIDSAPDIAAAVNSLLAEIGKPPLPLPEVRHMIGDGMAKLLARALDACGHACAEAEILELAERCLAIYDARPVVETRAFEGVAETLGHLAGSGYRLAVCTNKPDGPARTILDALGLSHHFAAVVGAASAPALKPDPRALAHTLAQMGMAPATAVMVGDSANDVGVARALGVPSVCMTYGYSTVPVHSLGADILLDDFADLIGTLPDL